MLSHEIEAFGRRMGLEGLTLPDSGPLAFDVEGMGRLSLEYLAESNELLVYLLAAVPAYDHNAARRVLELCDYRRGLPFSLSGGLYKGNLMLLTRLSEKNLTAGSLEATIRTLNSLFQTVLK